MRNGGYILVVAPIDYPGFRYRGRYAYEHRVMWWRHTGEMPPPGWVIHHKNGDKHDNRPENLEVLTESYHVVLHNKSRRGPTRHGTSTAYTHHKCRCETCRLARNKATNEYRWRTGRRVPRSAKSKQPACYAG